MELWFCLALPEGGKVSLLSVQDTNDSLVMACAYSFSLFDKS